MINKTYFVAINNLRDVHDIGDISTKILVDVGGKSPKGNTGVVEGNDILEFHFEDNRKGEKNT